VDVWGLTLVADPLAMRSMVAREEKPELAAKGVEEYDYVVAGADKSEYVRSTSRSLFWFSSPRATLP
jgi:hypothetical protein